MDEQINYAAQYTPVNSEGDVSDGSVDYYDFNWGDPVTELQDALDVSQSDCCGCCKNNQHMHKSEERTEKDSEFDIKKYEIKQI